MLISELSAILFYSLAVEESLKITHDANSHSISVSTFASSSSYSIS